MSHVTFLLDSAAHRAGAIPNIKLGGVGQDDEPNKYIDYPSMLKISQTPSDINYAPKGKLWMERRSQTRGIFFTIIYMI